MDFRTQTFVSRRANVIADIAQRRTELQERLKRLRDYLSLFDRRNEIVSKIDNLQIEAQELEAIIDAASDRSAEFNERVDYLDEQFRTILERFKPPRIPNAEYADAHHSTYIDRSTYRPVVEGRRFDQLLSPGFLVLVNVAHALAHQLTAITYDLALPNILLIDGVSNNLGTEELDSERLEAVYEYLIEVGDTYRDRLQLVVADNTVPEQATAYIQVSLSEEEKLIPAGLING